MKKYLVPFVVGMGLSCTTLAASKPLIEVKLVFLEALAPKDSTASERFRKDYESAIELAKKLTAPTLSQCGYNFDMKSSLYDANDPIQAKELGEKAQKDGAWLIIGPRRSNHYLLLVKGVPNTPTVSIMASGGDPADLGTLHYSLSPTDAEMAKVAAQQIAAQMPRSKYISVVSSDCVSCKVFAEHFEQSGKALHLQSIRKLEITGDLPDTKAILKAVKALKPQFILLPDYSKVASHVMAAVHKTNPDIYFVGGDGWGDSSFGFVQNGQYIGTSAGLTVRGFPPVTSGLKEFDLGRKAMGSPDRPSSGPSMAILRALDSTTQLLCKARPKDAAAFTKAFETSAQRLFSAPWGVSVYSLKNGEITFKETVPR